MLRITQNSHVNGAKSSYSTGDYYSERQEFTGRWRGGAALRLGLQGNVRQADWDALCDNRQHGLGRGRTQATENEGDRTRSTYSDMKRLTRDDNR